MSSNPDSGTTSQSYLSKLSPWSRSPVVQPSKGKNGEPNEPLLKSQNGADHIVTQRHRLSLRKYPRDCPPLRPMWFHAVDSPKRRPNPAGKSGKAEKALPAPKKYAPFSVKDSKAIEAAYRRLSEEREKVDGDEMLGGDIALLRHERKASADTKPNLSLEDDLKPGKVRVPVNEDYLFDVDVERRELGPAYWLGPVYDVRRGSWFYQDGSVQKPCDENLAEQLEDGYLKVKAWKLPPIQGSSKSRSNSQPRRPTSWGGGLTPEDAAKPAASAPITPKGSHPDLRKQAVEQAASPPHSIAPELDENEALQNTYRLFGSHMNSVVTYVDSNTAWLLSDDFLSRMNYTMYQRFAGGGHLGGMKLTRGYINPSKKAESKDDNTAESKSTSNETTNKHDTENASATTGETTDAQSPSEARRIKLERHMSSLLEEASSEDVEKQEEELRKRDEREMEEDYREQHGESQDREIEHLILVTHGIGQRLGLRIESVNFVHDVNTLRKTIKAVYADSPDLRALNAELGKAEAPNSRIQVLPICWRHLLDFPKQSLKHNRKEHDLGDTEFDDDDYPSLEDISVDGVPAVRNLITDLALDILLYQSPAYKSHISRIVLDECNRIYHLFMERNPTFNGKVSLIGHSLGSAIMFDLLCHQEQQSPYHKPRRHSNRDNHNNLKLDFEVDDFYALGSPIGLFQMLKGRTIVARQTLTARTRAFSTSMDDPMLDSAATSAAKKKSTRPTPATDFPDTALSSPKCKQIYNLFHPTDPISYRLEPLISASMATLKPQPLPYTKRGIFGAPMGQGLTGIGARVTQSVSSMWSSVASNLLTRGLGYTGTEPGVSGATQQDGGRKSSGPLSMGAGAGAGYIPPAAIPKAPPLGPLGDAGGVAKVSAGDSVRSNPENGGDAMAAAAGEGEEEARSATLIDSELETLFSGFQKRRKSAQSDAESRDLGTGGLSEGDAEWQEAEERAKRLRREEEKVRRLNSNGRVDYAIQEGAFDINLIAAIASHLSYWSDEDVSHFIISQLLSRRRVVRPASAGVTTSGEVDLAR